MAKIKCPLKRRGRASHEWNDGIKDHIYCLGYMSKITDGLVPICRECPDNVNKAQGDLDKWNRTPPLNFLGKKLGGNDNER